MAPTQTRPPLPSPDPREGSGPGGGAERRIRPRRGLPGGRAVVGGLLVAVAAVGTFATVSGAGRGPDTEYYVAARDLPPGATLGADDVEAVAIDVPDGLRGRAFSDPSALVGAVVVGPLSRGELIQAGGLATGRDAQVPTFSIALPEADANAGDLSRGDFVQVFATYGSDTSGTTVNLSTDARVVSIADGSDSIAAAGQVVVRLQVPSAEERSAIINATVTGRLALVRVSGAEGDVEATPRYRPDLDPDTAASGEGSADDDSAGGDGARGGRGASDGGDDG